ncbi:MAG: response regulator receiver protein [Caulobacter sp.]|nr:response regulator receiver protein [Caulobacter sp.]
MAASAQPLIGTARDWAVDLTVATLAGLFLGLAGPFGSYLSAAPQVRVAYWVGCLWIGAVLFGVGLRLVLWLGDRARLPRWFSLAAGAVIVAAPLALAVALIARGLWPFLKSYSPLDWYGQCLVVAAPLVLAQAALRRDLLRPTPGPAVVTAAKTPLAAEIASESLLCLQMEDHYVRVHRADGSRLVHATFGQAMAALSQVEGLQVHRSWWVARHAVAGAVTEGRKIRLILVNNLSVPVSRASVARLRQAGWLGFSEL